MDWQTLRNQFMRDIGGDPPGAQLEDWLIQAYADHPTAIERAFEKITLAHKAGKIRSPWGALKTEAAKAIDATRNPTHDRGNTRNAAIARAEQWLKTAGIHYDRDTELVDELLGDRGILRAYTGDEHLKRRILDAWQPEIGEQLQRDQDERLARWAAQNPHRTTVVADPKQA